MEKVYDIESFSFKIYRAIPGLITIILITSPLWATLLGFPQLVLYYVTFLAVFWLYKSFISSAAIVLGYNRMKSTLTVDWNKKLENINWDALPNKEDLPKSLDGFYMAIIIPFYKESYDVLSSTMDAIVKSEINKKRLLVVLGVEESGGPEALQHAERLKKEYSKHFRLLEYYIHPKDIPGEVKGINGANLRFAAKAFYQRLQEEKINPEHVFMLKYDSDLQVHPKLIAALGFKYLITPDRKHAFYSPAIMLYSNNYWDVPILIRVFSGSLTLALLSEWVTAKRNKQSFSCYGFNYQLLHEIDYWDPKIGVDDTAFFWNAYLCSNGKFRGEEVYIPTYSDAVQSNTVVGTHLVLYKQLLRWGWGVIVYPMTMQGLLRNKKISIHEKMRSITELVRAYNMWVTIAFLLTFGIPLVVLLNNSFSFQSIAHVLPRIVSYVLSFSLVGLLPSRWALEAFYGAPPKSKGKLFHFWHYLEQLLLTINALTFGFLPHIQAQVEMMLGKHKKAHLVTPKYRANK